MDQGLGKLIEKVSAKAWKTISRTHFFTPLGMNDTFYNVPNEKVVRLIRTHRRQADGAIGRPKNRRILWCRSRRAAAGSHRPRPITFV